MADLKVDYQILDQTGITLGGLHDEFNGIKVQVGSYRGAMGSGDVAGAMDGFAGNWDHHRQKLLDSIKSLGGMVDQTKKAFQQADNQLAADLTKKT